LAFSEQAIVHPQQLAQLFVPESNDRLLEGAARVELLRQAFRDENLRTALPILSQHRFRPRFFEGLDRSLQQGRWLFSHPEEAQVLRGRLDEVRQDPKREEFFLLNGYWERLLELRELWDEPRIFEIASQRISESDFSKSVFVLEHFVNPPRLKGFWDELSRKTEVTKIPSHSLVSEKVVSLTRKQAHSLEDAAHFLLDLLVDEAGADASALDRHAIVIPDDPSVRRSLKRVAESRGIPLQDPRDPTLIVQSEAIKRATLEMELVARGFPSSLVLAWITTHPELRSQAGEYRKKIIESGTVQGIESYARIEPVRDALSALQTRYPSRLTLAELNQAISDSIAALSLPAWVDSVFERFFSQWVQSFEQIGLQHRKRPLRYWLEQVQEKLRRATPVATPFKNRTGLRLFRVDQAVAFGGEAPDGLSVHFFGVPPSFFEPREEGNEWFSARDREILSTEFGLPSYRETQAQAAQSFQSWARWGETSVFWDYEYDEGGSEVESCDLNLGALSSLVLNEKEKLSAHPKTIPSLQSRLKERSPEVCVPLPKTEWPVSFLNAYGNCAFTAYAGFLLSLYDEREPDFELQGDAYGNLVHAALEKIVTEKGEIDLIDIFDFAWKKTRPVAWFKSERLYRAIRYRTLKLLANFLESETEYRTRSGAEPAHLEYPIEWEKNGLYFKGRIDRVDQHSEGLVLMDYKTGSSVPNGKETLEKGLGLQLPLYALALKEKSNQEVVAAQYLKLNPNEVNRNAGILFSRYNRARKSDPVEHPITTARSNVASLFSEAPDEIWSQVDQKISELIDRAKEGHFTANPAKPADCERCRYQLVCGRLRVGSESEKGADGAGSAARSGADFVGTD